MNIGQQYTMSHYCQTEMHQPSIQPPLPQLDEILRTLNYIATKVRTDGGFSNDMASQLRKRGYDVPTDSAKVVMKVFALAVNDAIQEKVNLTDEKGLHQLLTRDTPNPKSTPKPLNYYLNLNQDLEMAKSPLDLAECLKKNVPQWFVRNIIQHQFDIRWDTENGEPDDYHFYQFCDMKNTTRLLKYSPRLAHVQATLYKKCRRICGERRISENKEWLCPTVYIRTNDGWKTWRADEDKFTRVKNIIDDLSWIDRDILEFITQNADVQRGDSQESLKNSLQKPTLYWAVLKDGDFIPGQLQNLKLESISGTQVYVGKANNGIRGRWTKDKDNHCQMMKKCLDNVCAMTTYDPLRLEGIQLVDARLALANVRGERTALFVMKTFGDDVEKAKIKLRPSLDKVRKYFVNIPGFSRDIDETDELYCEIRECEQKIFDETAKVFSDNAEISSDEVQAELDTVQKYLNATEEYFDKVQVSSDFQDMIKKLQQELDEAKDCVEDLQNGSKKDKPLAEELLKEAEKQHRDGKRILNKRLNIIPSSVLRAKGRWQPRDMKYGMNSC